MSKEKVTHKVTFKLVYETTSMPAGGISALQKSLEEALRHWPGCTLTAIAHFQTTKQELNPDVDN